MKLLIDWKRIIYEMCCDFTTIFNFVNNIKQMKI